MSLLNFKLTNCMTVRIFYNKPQSTIRVWLNKVELIGVMYFWASEEVGMRDFVEEGRVLKAIAWYTS